MATNPSRHPFKVGEEYENEIGEYTVTALEPPDMVVQYNNGQMMRSSIALQMRIWERIQDEKRMAARNTSRASSTKRNSGGKSRSGYGQKFHGLVESDFEPGLAGTSWRRRPELGGLLAAQTTEKTGKTFDSMSVPRRPQVHVAFPNHYPKKNKDHVAKFLFDVSEEGVYFSFYIEKSDEPMDDSWDWPTFVQALSEDAKLHARVQVAMDELDLVWTIEYEDSGEENLFVSAEEGSLYVRSAEDDEREQIDWAGFTQRLRDLPDDVWCNLYLGKSIDKERALELGVGIANEATNVYQTLLPLYEASISKGSKE